ncbi:hypothetical protein EVAR_95684_1 [Eumeta japonica]|uniref:Uncharacterized protein n=1 Tax=Eumeta variegata TaxID=151549 RepID=A0A4C1VM35_EUMVA|nr:hypothetical protein EVAR_95684_1 [Eumeta japonica]
MPELPDCLSRRYKAVDELITTLSARYDKKVFRDSPSDVYNSEDVGIKLMCDFWNILKENPNCDLTHIVKERLGLNSKSSNLLRGYQCYTTENLKGASCCKITSGPERFEQESTGKKSVDDLSLTKVLCNLKDAASTDRKCNIRINELMDKEKELREQIEMLEQREKDAQELLQQADCMWSCMEDAYKEKIVQKKDRLKEVAAERKKDLESQVENVDKYYKEITEKTNNKLNDMQAVKSDVDSYQKKLKALKADIETVKKNIQYKKQASDNEIKDLEQTIKHENYAKEKKDKEIAECIKGVRDEYKNICKALVQRKLQNSELKSEEQALQAEYDMLTESRNTCKDRCIEKKQSILEEIKKVDKEIAEFKLRCLRCHQNSSTTDIRRFCTDCPRCLEERDCLIKGDTCERDSAKDCICMKVKEKFLNNVFENMYSILETEVDAPSGKSIASAILKSLRKSKNGKLDLETRKKLQSFVLEGVKKDIDLTIVGGAVKTRCEEPCHRWPGGLECNCPKGPDNCICSKKAPLFPGCTLPKGKDMAGRGPYRLSSSCGPDRPMRTSTATYPDTPGISQGTQKRSSSQGKKLELKMGAQSKSGKEKERDCCCFAKNMRAAQCVLGPDSLDATTSGNSGKGPWSPANSTDISETKKGVKAANGKSYLCSKDRKCSNRDRMIEEVLGRHIGFISMGIKYYGTDSNVTQSNSNKPNTVKDLKSTKSHLLDTLYGVNSKPHEYSNTKNKSSLENDDEFVGKSYYLDDMQLEKLKGSIIGETDSESYIVDNTRNINGIKPEDLLKYLTSTATNPVITATSESSDNNARYFKVELENARVHHKEPQALLELTPSKNFMIVLDKEYEKEFKAEITRRVSESTNGVLLRRSHSGTYKITLKKEAEKETDAQCGKLVQSVSGKFKVIIHEKNDRTLLTIKKPQETPVNTSSYILACDKEDCACRQLPSDITNVNKSSSIVGYVEIAKEVFKNDQKTLKKIWVQPNFHLNKSEEEFLPKDNFTRKDFQKKKKQQTNIYDDEEKRNENFNYDPNKNDEKHFTNERYKNNSLYQNIVYHVGVDNTKLYNLSAKTNGQKRVKFNEIKKRNVKKSNKRIVPEQKKMGKGIENIDNHGKEKRKGKEYVYHKNSMMYNDLLVYSSHTLCPPRQHKCTNSMGSIVDKFCSMVNEKTLKKKCRHRPFSPKRLERSHKRDCSGGRPSHRNPSGPVGRQQTDNINNYYHMRNRIG